MSVETPELRAEMSAAEINDLPDEDFAYIEPGGEKDDEGKTTPRSLRHFPINDAAHVRNALARAAQSPFGDKAMPKIKAAAKKFGVDVATRSIPRRRKERHRAVPLLPEVRFFHTDRIEIREADTAGNLVALHGMVIRYNVGYDVRDRAGQFEETMVPGVAKDVLTGDTRFLFNHDGMPLARTTAGTMTFEDTPEGLWVDPVLDIRMQLANDLVIATERGDINQMSVGFVTGEDEWNARRDQRTVKRFKAMPDVSAVTYPASPTTQLEIAQRMAAYMLGDDDRARVRRVFMDVRGLDLRAGKVLSASNAEAIGNAIKTLHGVYDGAGLDVSALMDPDDQDAPEGVVDDTSLNDVDESDESTTPDDAAFGDSGSEGDGAGPALREDDPGDPVRDNEIERAREKRATAMRLQAEFVGLERRRTA